MIYINTNIYGPKLNKRQDLLEYENISILIV